MTARQAAFFMRTFADGTRLRILAALSQRPLGFGELRKTLKCSKERLSRHLRYLHDRRVVESRPAGNSVIYRLANAQHTLHSVALGAVGGCLGQLDEVQQDTLRLGRQPGGSDRARREPGGEDVLV
jgi:DNA-binding transcriptional ArsR family regulator